MWLIVIECGRKFTRDQLTLVTIVSIVTMEALDLWYKSCIVLYQHSHSADLNDISDDTVKQLCTGSHVFFNCLGTSRRQAGSAVRQ